MNRPLLLNETVGDPEPQGEDTRIVEVILDRLAMRQISVRMVSLQTGIKKSRASNILHRDPAKRHPIRIDEKAAILQVAGLSMIEAALAAEIKATSSGERYGQGSIATMLSHLIDGFPTDLVEMVEEIDGFEFSDIRPEHGRRLRALLLRFLKKHYAAEGARKLKRFDDGEEL